MQTEYLLPLKELNLLQKITLQRLFQRESEGEQLEPHLQSLLEAYRSDWQQQARNVRRFWPTALLLGAAVYGCMLYYTFAPKLPFFW